MNAILLILLAALATEGEPTMKMKSLTPVLTVQEIEPAVEFWTTRFGFEVSNEVTHDDRLGFVMLTRDDVLLMYQSEASLADDMAALAAEDAGESAMLFLQVEDLDAVEVALGGADIVVPRRETFYGSSEIAIREPGGHIVIFAEFGDGAEDE